MTFAQEIARTVSRNQFNLGAERGGDGTSGGRQDFDEYEPKSDGECRECGIWLLFMRQEKDNSYMMIAKIIFENGNIHNPVHYLDWGELVLIVLRESGRRSVFQECVIV